MSKRFLGKVLAVAIMVSLSIMGCGSTTTDDTKIENEEVTKETTEIKQKVTETSSDEKIVVRIGDMRTQYPVKASYELGLLQEAFGDNVEIELYTFGAGAELIEALAAGEIDISGGFGATPVIAGISAGYPITIINVSNTRFNQINTHGIITRIDSGIDSVEDIAGHTFGLMIGSGEYTAFNNILSKHGLAEKIRKVLSQGLKIRSLRKTSSS